MRKSWKRFISGFLLLASMITAWPVNQFVEAEELPVYEQEENLNANSTQQTAQTIYVNSTYADKLESSSDQNWYKLQLATMDIYPWIFHMIILVVVAHTGPHIYMMKT